MLFERMVIIVLNPTLDIMCWYSGMLKVENVHALMYGDLLTDVADVEWCVDRWGRGGDNVQWCVDRWGHPYAVAAVQCVC